MRRAWIVGLMVVAACRGSAAKPSSTTIDAAQEDPGLRNEQDLRTPAELKAERQEREQAETMAIMAKHQQASPFADLGDAGLRLPDVNGEPACDGCSRPSPIARPSVKFHKLELVDGDALDPAWEQKLRERYTYEVESCYVHELKLDSTAHGKLTLELTIAPSGRVTDAIVDGVLDEVNACVKAKTRSWMFHPAPSATTTVSLVIDLTTIAR